MIIVIGIAELSHRIHSNIRGAEMFITSVPSNYSDWRGHVDSHCWNGQSSAMRSLYFPTSNNNKKEKQPKRDARQYLTHIENR